jgi:hypothetical protein
MAEYLLIGLTLAAGIVGTVGDHFSLRIKLALIAFVVVTSLASWWKLREDNVDKQFLKLALTSTLVPANSDYNGFYKDFDAAAAARGFEVREYPCHHNLDGLTCFFASPDASKHGTLVLNKAEVSSLYASQFRGESNRSKSEALFNKRFEPSISNEEFLDKAGIVGFHTFYNMYHSFPESYMYDDSIGIKVSWESAEKTKQVVQITPGDISRIPSGSGLDVFRKIEELYRERFRLASAP